MIVNIINTDAINFSYCAIIKKSSVWSKQLATCYFRSLTLNCDIKSHDFNNWCGESWGREAGLTSVVASM